MIVIHANGEYSGLVCQNPDNPKVPNPGKWFANVLTVDCFPYWFKNPFSTEKEAVAAVMDALEKNKTARDLERDEIWLSSQ